MFDEDLKRTEPCTFDELKDDEYSNFIAVHHEFVASTKAVIAGQYAKRYGFVYVDRHDNGTGDFSRSRKDSFFWYKKVCESNGEII